MRVIAGRLKRRQLLSPTWDGVRPTSDRLRESFFDILGARIAGANVLDAYAGTGAVGIEAISRGAAHVTFVDGDRRAVALIERNLSRCGVSGGYTVLLRRWPAAASSLPSTPFDIVWLDPPYDVDDLGEPLEAAAAHVAPGGLLVLEHASRREPPDRAGTRARGRVVRAGDSMLSFYTPPPEPVAEEPPR